MKKLMNLFLVMLISFSVSNAIQAQDARKATKAVLSKECTTVFKQYVKDGQIMVFNDSQQGPVKCKVKYEKDGTISFAIGAVGKVTGPTFGMVYNDATKTVQINSPQGKPVGAFSVKANANGLNEIQCK